MHGAFSAAGGDFRDTRAESGTVCVLCVFNFSRGLKNSRNILTIRDVVILNTICFNFC